ncbi:NACHT domain-containing protein [Streptomyces sp. AJS327]|uniref:NACHT domain-containing protein n=1 Tax=Streptomyces sp. AJS327 TaxID=2545265 RepID=UPI0015DE5859|nr:NACHT domain-containing protein [Streptomyces sp. AJS327]MBA0052464.1 NACHT domain-containing protein [Streptomyces sp. AJS327]
MDIPTVGARLASSAVVPLVRKLLVQESPGAGLVDAPIRLSRLVSFRGEKRTLSDRDFRRISEELVRRAAESTGMSERLPSYELQAVANALTHSLRTLGDLEMDDVQAVQLGPQGLSRRIRIESSAATSGLSQGARELHQKLLDTACLHILNFFTQRAHFTGRTLVEQSQRLAELSARVDELISRTPSPADVPFEKRYAEYVTSRHSQLTIFGLDLPVGADSWPLNVAYLSLEATDGPTHIPAEQSLSHNKRVLLRGVAGSGKSTLVQWLAVSTARSNQENLLYLYGLVPFILPLRTLTRDGGPLPPPEDFLRAVDCPISGAQPTGWIDRVLTEGRGILLVDGIDEVPEGERQQARDWLRNLVSAFPDNRWLVTTRPSAIRENWLTPEGFVELDLAPMSRDDVAAFIHRWHHAAGAGDFSARSLLQAVRTKQDLGRLATNPLMCALICALYRDRRGYLPDGRKALYDAALSMLLSRRDRERGLQQPGAIRISEAHQIQLLQKLAYWMIRNGRSEVSRSDAVDLLGQSLPAMPSVGEQGTPEEIYRHLLIRSGLLREPAVGAVDFIHRSFQDYLGAKAAVEDLDFGLLAQHAHLDQWEDVIRMAVAHARPRERVTFLDTILELADAATSTSYGHRLYLLAAACLEHATELDPLVRTAVQERAAMLIPPASAEQARALADVGLFVLELLPGPEDGSGTDHHLTVLTATRIGTSSAIPVLARYRATRDPRVQRQLVDAWHAFEPHEYAQEIIAHLPDDGGLYFPVTNLDEVRALQSVGGRSHVHLAGRIDGEEFCAAYRTSRITHLRVSADCEDGWDWLPRLYKLRTLFVDVPHFSLRPLRRNPYLRQVRFLEGTPVADQSSLPDHVSVEVLGRDPQPGLLQD